MGLVSLKTTILFSTHLYDLDALSVGRLGTLQASRHRPLQQPC